MQSILASTPPSTHVQMLLGECDEDDEERQSHDIFCELGELRPGAEGLMEWKETARYAHTNKTVCDHEVVIIILLMFQGENHNIVEDL